MSTVSDLVKCPQCGNEEADYTFDCRTSAEDTLCNRCGYLESWEPDHGEDGKFLDWKHETRRGFGVLWYRRTGGIAFACHSLHSHEDVAEAERWLREQLAAGTVEEETARLTRWNNETQSIDLVIGTLDYAGKMEQVVADLGLKPVRSSPGQAVRFAILPGKAAVVRNSPWVVMPVLHYLNADPSSGNYMKRTDGSMPAIEYELGYLALSRSELKEINNLQEPEQSSYGIDIVMSVSSSEFGRNFRRVCKRARWTLDHAIEKRVRAIIAEASFELATKCTSRSDIRMFADLAAAYRKDEKPVSGAAPMNNRNGAAAQMPVTLDQWHRALGFYKCVTCGAPIGNGIRYAWQGRNRWCEKCFWGEDSEDAFTKIPAESGAPEKEKTDADH